MKPPKFTYACPRSVEEALALLAHGGDEAHGSGKCTG
jgi:CO/xanthine dehydrogenase FAD-binding subunit